MEIDGNNNSTASKKQRNIDGLCLGSIEFVRVKEIDGIGDEEPSQRIYGSVIVTDTYGDEIVYHRHMFEPECKGPGDFLSLFGPGRAISAASWFHIYVHLSVTWWDRATAKQITKELAKGEITWHPFTVDRESIGKPVENIVRGKHGSVTVGFSVIQKSVIATTKFVMMNGLQAQICGTIKALRISRESSITQMLFEKSAEEWVQVDPKQSIPLSRPAVFPVPVDSNFTIEVDLMNSTNDQIALGRVQFTPELGMQSKNIIGTDLEVQVSFTSY